MIKMAEELTRKESELINLRNRYHRYWRKLLKVSIKIAKERGIETIVIEDYDDQINIALRNPDVIQVYQENDIVNADELIELSKDVMPSLYRRYHGSKRKYYSELKKLENN